MVKLVLSIASRTVIAAGMMLAFCLPTPLLAQKVSEKEKDAVKVLKGILTEKSKENAVNVLHSAAVNDSSAYAMNALGMAYMYGLGVTENSAQASHWLTLAGNNGYPEAFHNLGLMYKDAHAGAAQDFTKAYESFMAGTRLCSVMCDYDAGFMLYKGLGCQQSYKQAMEMFQKGSDQDHSPCLYMLGLCYRNGYGVEQDTARAAFYLNRAALLGYAKSWEELRREKPENYLHEQSSTIDTLADVPLSMPEINSSTNDTSLIAGRYQGILVMYDWSGKYILGEKPVILSINRVSGEFCGKMYVNNDTVDFKAEMTPDGYLVFKDGEVRLGERYINSHAVPYRLEYAKLDVWSNNMSGQLALYSLKLKEPERPMYLELYKEGQTGNAEDMAENGLNRITASPNPFDNSFTTKFELSEDVENVQARIFDKSGLMVEVINLGNMQKGKHRATMQPTINNGMYVLNLKAGKQTLRTIIVKRGGVQ